MSAIKRFLIAFLPLVVFVFLSLFLLRGLNYDPKKIDSVLINHPAPHFQSKTLLSQQAVDESIFKGHISLLNVWATWCITCRVEHPYLMEYAKRKDIALIGLDYKDESVAAMDWLLRYGNPYQTIIQDTQGNIAIDFGVYGTPETFVIDKKGIIRYKFIGALNDEKFQAQIVPIIQKLKAEG